MRSHAVNLRDIPELLLATLAAIVPGGSSPERALVEDWFISFNPLDCGIRLLCMLLGCTCFHW